MHSTNVTTFEMARESVAQMIAHLQKHCEFQSGAIIAAAWVMLAIGIPGCAAHRPVMPLVVSPAADADTQDPVAKYRLDVAFAVHRHWAYPADADCNGTTEISFTVLPSGQVEGVRIDKESGCDGLSQSASSAVFCAAPFRPFPKSLTLEKVTVGLRFRPDGMR